MKRKTPTRRGARGSAPKPAPESGCRALVWVDGSAIRRKIRKDYEKARKSLDGAREDLRRFETVDRPAFTQWISREFGALLTEIRELDQDLMKDSTLIMLVNDEILFTGCTAAQGYRRVTEAAEKPPKAPPEWESTDEPEFDFGGGPGTKSGHDPKQDPFEDSFDEAFEDLFEETMFGRRGRGGRGVPRPDEQPRARTGGRVKELYRALARRLHPDAQAEMTPQKAEWWHQAQAAYEAGDEEQLAVILSLCEISEQGTTDHTSASLLHRITEELKRSLREVRHRLTGHRRDPAWNFAASTDREGVARRMRRSFEFELETLRMQSRQAKATIERWKAAADKIRQRRRQTPRKRPSDA